MAKKQPKFHGIMDCHGIDSLYPFDEQQAFMFQLRATSNDQRQALYFTADLTDEEMTTVRGMLNKEDVEAACLFIKSCDKVKYHGPGNVNLIPNPKIDPWDDGNAATKKELEDAGLGHFAHRLGGEG